MSIQKVREYLAPLGLAERIREFDVSSATVELAAVAVGVEGARIAKSLSFKLGEGAIIGEESTAARKRSGSCSSRRDATAPPMEWAKINQGRGIVSL